MQPVWPRCNRCSKVRGRTRSRLRRILAARGELPAATGAEGACSHASLRRAGDRLR